MASGSSLIKQAHRCIRVDNIPSEISLSTSWFDGGYEAIPERHGLSSYRQVYFCSTVSSI